MRKKVLFEHPGADLRVFIVWADMLASDGVQPVEGVSQMFRDGRAGQYHDPMRHAGLAFATGPFAGYIAQAAASVPPDHPLRAMLTQRPAGDAPLWDVYMYFDPGQEWDAAPPRPVRWIKQVYYEPGKDSLFWRDDFAAPPIEGDLTRAIERITNEFLAASSKNAEFLIRD